MNAASGGGRTRPVVETATGAVRGIARGASVAFLGVPFAAPPIGELRFREPRPHPGWTGVRDASRYGATPQRRPFGPVTTIPEPSVSGDSTLNVNVFTPSPGDVSVGLPVLVWIHGGGYLAGSPASPWYDGRSFNRDGVVTVTISYRLGFDGFGWIDDAPANRGILDQIAALEWVRDNIRAFGGDPRRITIAGQSAGGGSVLALLAIPRARNLFAGAISHSGVVRVRSLAEARTIGRRFASEAGVDPTVAHWCQRSEEEILDRQVEFVPFPNDTWQPASEPHAQLRAVREHGPGGRLAFVPHVDGVLIEADVPESLAAGVGAEKPLLAGATAHEFTRAFDPFASEVGGSDASESLVRAGLDRRRAAALRAAFPDFDTARLLGQLMTEWLFRIPLLDLVEGRLAGGSRDRTWLYDFRLCSPVGGLAEHCHDLPFTWDLLDADGVARVLGDRPSRDVAAVMHGAWVGFIERGDPGWEPCHERSGGMVFDEHYATDSELHAFESIFRWSSPEGRRPRSAKPSTSS